MKLYVFLLNLPLVVMGAWWVGLQEMTNEEARKECYPGDLASFSTNQELHDLLSTNQHLRMALTNNSTAYFWIGLKKPKDMCVVPVLPQRGFRWSDGRQNSGLDVWREEPTDTCTNVRCGSVAVDLTGWGLVSQSCKTKNQFICGPPGSKPGPRPPGSRPGPLGSTLRPNPRPRPGSTTGPHRSTPRPRPGSTAGPEPGPDEPKETRPGLGETREAGLTSDSGSGLLPTAAHHIETHSEGPFFGTSCGPPVVSGSRSLSPDVDRPELVLVQCWSGDNLLLLCKSGRWTWSRPLPGPGPEGLDGPGETEDADLVLNRSTDLDLVLNRSTELRCPSCDPGFMFEASECVDMDECSVGVCGVYRCQNLPGSFSCTPGPLLYALVAVAVVMLLLVVVVTALCCIRTKRRQDQKHDQNQSEV